MITITYREPGDFLSDEKPGDVKKMIITTTPARVGVDDGWIVVRDNFARVLFMVAAHKVIDVTGEYKDATEG